MFTSYCIILYRIILRCVKGHVSLDGGAAAPPSPRAPLPNNNNDNINNYDKDNNHDNTNNTNNINNNDSDRINGNDN